LTTPLSGIDDKLNDEFISRLALIIAEECENVSTKAVVAQEILYFTKNNSKAVGYSYFNENDEVVESEEKSQ